MFTNIERNQLRYNRIIQNDDISLYDSKFNIIDQTIRSIKIIQHLGIDKDRKHYYLGKCIYCNSEIILTYEQLHHNKRLCECEQKYKFRTIDHDIKQLYRFQDFMSVNEDTNELTLTIEDFVTDDVTNSYSYTLNQYGMLLSYDLISYNSLKTLTGTIRVSYNEIL